MKKLLRQVFFERLSSKDLEELTTEVKETIDHTNDLPATEKRFTGAELWKIQQGKKSVTLRNRFR